ncbi:diaminopimelate epimerase [Kyrpidia tusciae]|uniref:Diaminopimelate epimerase n=1 Tax=Kyrpidia tusciae (strain DSM 2912 / NBRC 15312 / T2) TaxID=562970 RepID=D5WP68_KYRT2|nr:diaminopimelate epimerase [Kyrpidia tusciae]ADG06127.1 diaminopimelate epimerase [Kyrpidia tusciae DSM 2912]
MKFVKMHGLGNDFIVVEGHALPLDPGALARNWCDRHFGIGADGLVFVLPSDRADVQMRIFNADGSEAEQCGNAVRCVGKYAFERGLVRRRDLVVETLAGVQRIVLGGNGSRVEEVTVDMGEPILEPGRIPVALAEGGTPSGRVEAAGREWAFTAVSMGNPHAVIFVDDVEGTDVRGVGSEVETNRLFPNRVNVEFVETLDPGEIRVRVWERGCGETLACGTGACAAVVAGALEGRSGRKVRVHLPGGTLKIEWAEDGRVYMTGPAVEVFRGEIGQPD